MAVKTKAKAKPNKNNKKTQNWRGTQANGAQGSAEELIRPCVDCGQWTCSCCDFSGECFACINVPDESWVPRQMTPFCTGCKRQIAACHFCWNGPWCRPQAWGRRDGWLIRALLSYFLQGRHRCRATTTASRNELHPL